MKSYGTYFQNDPERPLVYGEVELINPPRQRLRGEPLKEGVLVHPVWMTTRAYFTKLEVVQEPLPDYVRYRFAFCEAGSEGAALKEVSTSAAGGSAAGTAGARYHTVVQGDTLWAIAARNGTTVRALCALNPQIANPNRIYPGERVRLS